MKEAGFTDKTIKALREHEFNSIESIALLDGHDDVVSELGLNIQQRLLLIKTASSHP